MPEENADHQPPNLARRTKRLCPVHDKVGYVQLKEDMNGRPFSEEELTVAVGKVGESRWTRPYTTRNH